MRLDIVLSCVSVKRNVLRVFKKLTEGRCQSVLISTYFCFIRLFVNISARQFGFTRVLQQFDVVAKVN